MPGPGEGWNSMCMHASGDSCHEICVCLHDTKCMAMNLIKEISIVQTLQKEVFEVVYSSAAFSLLYIMHEERMK